MNLRASLQFVALLVVGLAPVALQAQALPTASGPGSYIAIGGGASIFQADYGQRKLGGGFIYADVNPTWRYGIEAEARYLRYNTDENVTETDYLLGPKVTILKGRIKPYGKFLIGSGKIIFPFDYAQGTFLTYAPGGGVEYQLTDRLNVKVIDFEYQMWQKFPYGSLHPYGISAGISFRINGLARYPKR